MSKQLTVREVAEKAAEAMVAMGQRPTSVWRNFYPRCTHLVNYYEKQGLEYYDPAVTAAYISAQTARVNSDDLSQKNYRLFRKTAERMDEVFLTGRITWSCKSRHERKPLTPYFQTLHEEYLQSADFHPNTREDVNWAVYKHLYWLMEKGHSDFSRVTEKTIGEYVSHSFRKLCPGSVRNILSYTRKFYDFLKAQGKISIFYDGFLSTRITRPEKIQAALTQEETEATLAQINRATPLGKRDYAAILLGARMGLRAGDIVRMELQDIDWKEGQIKIHQQKTGEPLLLPLPVDVSEALKEYILRVRPASEYKEVFLRANAPFQPLAAGSALGYNLQKYQRMAGIERKPFDGKGFHSLRRMLGKEMTVAGIPSTTVAQVLGHRNLNTVKQYISLDAVHLKECALDFRGIELTGGAL